MFSNKIFIFTLLFAAVLASKPWHTTVTDCEELDDCQVSWDRFDNEASYDLSSEGGVYDSENDQTCYSFTITVGGSPGLSHMVLNLPCYESTPSGWQDAGKDGSIKTAFVYGYKDDRGLESGSRTTTFCVPGEATDGQVDFYVKGAKLWAQTQIIGPVSCDTETPSNEITNTFCFDGNLYATLDNAAADDSSSSSDCTALPLPDGFSIADNTEATRAAVMGSRFTFGAANLVTADGSVISATTGANLGGSVLTEATSGGVTTYSVSSNCGSSRILITRPMETGDDATCVSYEPSPAVEPTIVCAEGVDYAAMVGDASSSGSCQDAGFTLPAGWTIVPSWSSALASAVAAGDFGDSSTSLVTADGEAHTAAGVNTGSNQLLQVGDYYAVADCYAHVLLMRANAGCVPEPPVEESCSACEVTSFVSDAGRDYALLDCTDPSSTDVGCQDVTYAIPEGWSIAEDTAVNRAALNGYTWGTGCVVFANGVSRDPCTLEICDEDELINDDGCYSVARCDLRVMIVRDAVDIGAAIENGDFSVLDGGIFSSWTQYGSGYQVSDGSLCIAAPTEDEAGAEQTITLDPDTVLQGGFMIYASSSATDVSGSPSADYSIYVDIFFTDGTSDLGHHSDFNTGTHDFEANSIEIFPTTGKLIDYVNVYLLFRHQETGQACFTSVTAGPSSGNLILNPEFDPTPDGEDIDCSAYTYSGVGGANSDKVAICHGTSSASNTHVLIVVDRSSVWEPAVEGECPPDMPAEKKHMIGCNHGPAPQHYADVWPGTNGLGCDCQPATPADEWTGSYTISEDAGICMDTSANEGGDFLSQQVITFDEPQAADAVYVSAWSKADGISANANPASFSVYLDIEFESGEIVYGAYVAMPDSDHGWTLTDDTLLLPDYGAVVGITVTLRFVDHEDGVVCFAQPLVKLVNTACGSSGGGSHGDPHLISLDGALFDLQAVGEFVLTKDAALEVQVRHAVAGQAAVTSAVAIAYGETRVSIVRSEEAGAILPAVMINGARITELDTLGARFFSTKDGSFTRTGVFTHTTANGYSGEIEYRLHFPATAHTVTVTGFISTYGVTYFRVLVAYPQSSEGFTSGLLGNYNGMATDDLRDATNRFYDAATITHSELYELVAEAWRVTEENSLFDYKDGQSTATYTDRAFYSTKPHIDMASELYAQASAHCNSLGLTSAMYEACVYDAYLTGDVPGFTQGMSSTEQRMPMQDSPLTLPEIQTQEYVEPAPASNLNLVLGLVGAGVVLITVALGAALFVHKRKQETRRSNDDNGFAMVADNEL